MSKQEQERKMSSARDWATKQDRGSESTSVKLPKDVPFFSFKREGIYKLDVISYTAGEGNPRADAGIVHFERTYFAHRIPSPGGRAKLYCCRAETFGKKCHVCQWLAKQPENDITKDMRAKKRQLWNVIDLADKDKGIQVLDTYYYKGLGEQLKDLLETSEAFVEFAHPTRGMTLQIKVQEKPMGKGKFFAVARVDAVPRVKQYKWDIVDDAVCLDDCLICPTNEELADALNMGEDEDETPRRRQDEDDDAPKARTRREEPEEEETPRRNGRKPVEEEEEEEEAPKPKSRKPSIDDEDDAPAPKPKSRVTTYDPDEDEEAPKPKSKSRKPSIDDEDDDMPVKGKSRAKDEDDDGWGDDDAPAPKTKGKKPADDEEEDDIPRRGTRK